MSQVETREKWNRAKIIAEHQHGNLGSHGVVDMDKLSDSFPHSRRKVFAFPAIKFAAEIRKN